MERIKLRCFAFKSTEDKLFYAFCIDLNLAAQGDSLEIVKNKLSENIKLYLDHELEYNKNKGIDTFPFRPSPISIRLKYHFVVFIIRFAKLVSKIELTTNKFICSFNTQNNSMELIPA